MMKNKRNAQYSSLVTRKRASGGVRRSPQVHLMYKCITSAPFP